ncbi:AraC family transcriptional regulator [Flavobacterium ardleyense]|uniref:AraC family transcriptional regulator n=1 Tax=Flavobacterium ardleyense TaxID=2038737 RepID=A0ABW5Z531_9FLAO
MKNNLQLNWLLILVVLSKSSGVYATSAHIADSLANKPYSYLEKASNSKKLRKEKAITYAKAWIALAKSKQNWIELTKAYKTIMFLEDKKKLINYSDSLLATAKSSKEHRLLGSAYLTKGIVHYEKKELDSALDNYILAHQHISKTKDDYTIHKVKYAIANTKYYLGFYDETIDLLQECLVYFEEENDRAYLSTIHSLGLCYNKIGNFKRSTHYNNLGLQMSQELENSDMIPYFKQSEGINQYYNKRYSKALNNLKAIVPSIIAKNDFANEILTYFYIAKSYWALDQKENAIPYLIKVDEAFVQEGYSRPDIRENYELLISWYQDKKDMESQLIYINALIEVDKLLNKNYKYLSRKIFKEFDTTKLIAEKQEIEMKMKLRSNMLSIILFIAATIIIALMIRHRRNKKRYRQKFEELMKGKVDLKIPTSKTMEADLEINPEIIESVLYNLERFEKTKKYLEKDMNLNKIAVHLKTNTKYASKIIAKYRGKKTIDYINALKIDHVIEVLKTERRYRNYTNKALAEEIGFGSTQNFTRAFKKKTDISPCYFIEQLKEVNQ